MGARQFLGLVPMETCRTFKQKRESKTAGKKSNKKAHKNGKESSMFFPFYVFFFVALYLVFCYSAFAKKSDFLEPGALFWLFTIE